MFYLEGRTLSSFEPAQQSRYQFFTSQKNKLSSQNSVASPPSFHIMNHSGKAECFEHGNHVPIRHKTEHVVIHKTKAKEFQFYTLLTSSSQNSRNFRRRSLARRSSTAISCGICFIMRKSSFFLPSQPSQMDGAKITCFIQFWNKQTDGEHQRALLPSETRNFNFACLHAGADWASLLSDEYLFRPSFPIVYVQKFARKVSFPVETFASRRRSWKQQCLICHLGNIWGLPEHILPPSLKNFICAKLPNFVQ